MLLKTINITVGVLVTLTVGCAAVLFAVTLMHAAFSAWNSACQLMHS